jgi:hypothetical protein
MKLWTCSGATGKSLARSNAGEIEKRRQGAEGLGHAAASFNIWSSAVAM